MYKRLELHNHTTESDGSLTVAELIEYMQQDKADAFAITDHNTISAHPKAEKILSESALRHSYIYGMEYTTYYGHILCLNLKEYVSWENINLHKPELLFEAVQKTGALVGIAHPFSFGHPFARGCRFDMEINDFSAVDFIEISNNLEPLHEVNERGLLWWEELVLQGHKLAFSSGMDLHGKWNMHNHFATFIEGEFGGNIEEELNSAFKQQRTWISKGPLLAYELNPEQKSITFSIVDTKKPGFVNRENESYYLTLRTNENMVTKRFPKRETSLTVSYQDFSSPLAIPKLYLGEVCMENLVCVAPVITLS